MRVLPDDGTLTSTCKQYLANKLPPYMVPESFLIVSMLPLTANGKLDRTALASIQ